MSLRLWRRVRVAPGVTLNFTLRGLSSVSLGVRGAHATFSRRARRYTVGAPGTGLFLTERYKYVKPVPLGRFLAWVAGLSGAALVYHWLP